MSDHKLDTVFMPKGIMQIPPCIYGSQFSSFSERARMEFPQDSVNLFEARESIQSIFIGSWKTIKISGPPNFKNKRHRSLLFTLEDERGKRFVTRARYNHLYKYWFDFSSPRYEEYKVIAWAETPAPYEL